MRLPSSAFVDADGLDALEADAARHGFSPRRVGRGRRVELVLDVCPFADVAADDPATVCALHRGLAEGIMEGVGGARVETFVAHDPYRAGFRIRDTEDDMNIAPVRPARRDVATRNDGGVFVGGFSGRVS